MFLGHRAHSFCDYPIQPLDYNAFNPMDGI